MEGLAGIEPTLKGPQPSVQNRYTSDPNNKSMNFFNTYKIAHVVCNESDDF